MRQVKTISIDDELLKEVDAKVETGIFRDRSTYFRYLIEKDLHKRKADKKNIILVVLLLELSLVLLLVLLRVI